MKILQIEQIIKAFSLINDFINYHFINYHDFLIVIKYAIITAYLNKGRLYYGTSN